VGKFRIQGDGSWLDFHATQVYTVDQFGMLWDVIFTLGGRSIFCVRDRYVDGHGEIRATVGGFFTAMQRSSPEIDQETMLRYLNELVM
jgi:hypothetical protein